ncbi:MerR family transcriptional regulator [Streptococcus phocae subsp. salmonis]|uniref:MerR family transcriptional regulator n=1 Tax=Streptococcus phocae TaxID=119224 RepID=UPI000531AF6C|nr:MerR family transcriptional regulator [Streptococcus phocae]KGR72714.1 MerR family transcriptional regulator [Streptococcus phocae subsp. salmonis]
MSEWYSTGDLAKAAGVTVRTVQYYDRRKLLSPSAITEGGRRQYTEADLQKLNRILFLRDLDFSIDNIKKLLAEDNQDQVLEILLQGQIRQLKADIVDKNAKLDKSVKLLKEVEKEDHRSLDYLSEIALMLENQKEWRRLQLKNLLQLILLIAAYMLLLMLAVWLQPKWIMWVAIPSFIVLVNVWVWHYKKKVLYLCPNCHKTFEPTYKNFSLARHTPKTRKLTCPHCLQKSYCLELAKDI